MVNKKKVGGRVVWFQDIGLDDIALVGGKNASLGEMIRELVPQGIAVPDGFAITADAYREFLGQNDLERKVEDQICGWKVGDLDELAKRGRGIRRWILDARLPGGLEAEILKFYGELCSRANRPNLSVAVRSSATAEDLPDASFAGQQETYLNVSGPEELIAAVKKCFASLYTDRAISYRAHKRLDEVQGLALSIGVQMMVRSDLASAGVAFSIDTETGFRDVVLINAAFGLGETVVKGAVNPDEYYVFKPTIGGQRRPILRKKLGNKIIKMVYGRSAGQQTETVSVDELDQKRFALSDDDILKLASWCVVIEKHYSSKRDTFTPMDIEWAKDGLTGELFVVQARPETVHAQRRGEALEIYKLKEKKRLVILTGAAVGQKIVSGPVRVVHGVQDLVKLKPGEILVAEKTDPDWEPTMKTASGVITDRGGRTCHAAIVSRELGLAAVVGTGIGTKMLQDGELVTLSCAEGDIGKVCRGALKFETETIDVGSLKVTSTDVMLNIANPDEALCMSFLPNDGVGLARIEFIISHYIKVHPMALLDYDALKDLSVREKIDQLTFGYKDRAQFFVDKLAEGVGMIGAAFYPKPVIVRFSDFKTNEYAHLIGGESFEPTEENPMIGFRGASRYYHERYRRAFALECQAILKVRGVFGLDNVKVMIPFCRTLEEGKRVLHEMEQSGLWRSDQGLEVYVMCEIPSNVVLADEFAEIFDGFSIGSNDLTQLTLGIDRDSEILADLFDERNDAVTRLITQVIKAAKKRGRKIGICGQAPSDYPEFADFLVTAGIDSLSLNADAMVRTRRMLVERENRLRERSK